MSYTPELHCGGCKTDDEFCRSLCTSFEIREQRAKQPIPALLDCKPIKAVKPCAPCCID